MSIKPNDNQFPLAPIESSMVDDRTRLLRACADEELSAEEATRLAAHLDADPGDARVIQFERGLRASLAAVEPERAPQGLREKIEAIRLAEATPASASRENARARHPRDAASPRAHRRRLLGGVAACGLLAAVLAAALFAPGHTPLPTGQVAIVPSHRMALVAFVNDQHAECELYAEMVSERFRIGPPEDVPAALAQILSAPPDLGTLLTSNVEFLGAARCAVPGRGSSVHLVLRVKPVLPVPDGSAADAVQPQELVSLFVQQDHAELNIPQGKSFSMVPRDHTESVQLRRHIQVWRNNGLVYFLVSASRQSLEVAAGVVGSMEPGGEI